MVSFNSVDVFPAAPGRVWRRRRPGRVSVWVAGSAVARWAVPVLAGAAAGSALWAPRAAAFGFALSAAAVAAGLTPLAGRVTRQHRAASEKAAREARTDALTGVGNRLAWQEAIAEAGRLLDAQIRCSQAMLVADVNGLKAVNDRAGHAAGDALLRAFCDSTRAALPDGKLFRIGGDEFVVLLPDGADPAEARMRLTAAIAGQRGGAGRLSASVGAGVAGTAAGLDAAYRAADEASSADKRAFYTAAGADRRRPLPRRDF